MRVRELSKLDFDSRARKVSWPIRTRPCSRALFLTTPCSSPQLYPPQVKELKEKPGHNAKLPHKEEKLAATKRTLEDLTNR